MKSIVRLFLVLLLVVHVSGFAQIMEEKAGSKTAVITQSVAQPLSPKFATSILPTTGGTSGNARAPQGTFRYIRTCYVITAAELAAAGVPNGAKFSLLGFYYSVAQNIETTGAMKIYLQNTSDAAYAKPSLNWTNAPASNDGVIDQMTLVHDANVTIPAVPGYWDIPLSNGSAFTYSGGGIYVAYEYQNPTGTIATTANVALCNTNITTGLRNVFSATTLGTALGATASSFRPETKASWITNIKNDAALKAVYSFGKVPLVYGMPCTIKAFIQNLGDDNLTNVNVTLKITGANSFTSTKVIPSLPSSSMGVVVSFDPFTFTVAGNNTVNVSLGNDGNNANNSITSLLQTTSGSYAVADTSTPTGSLGFATTAGMMFVKYNINGSTKVNSVTATIGNSATNAGNIIYGVIADSAGTILAKSANYTIAAADYNKPVTFTFPTPVSVDSKPIYIGIAQNANATSGYYPLATQDENPGRSGVYYIISNLTGGVAYSEANSYGRYMIQADLVPAVVPVELSAFTAIAKEGVVTLNWSTATETNNSGFQIERKAVSENEWSVAGFVKGHSTTSSISSYTFVDNVAKFGAASYNYRLKQVDFDGTAKYYNLAHSVEISAPKTFSLDQNFPNPFNPTTSISFSIPSDSKVTLEVYDVLGKAVKTLVNENRAAGTYTVSFDASALSSGVYFYRLTAGENTMLKKMNLMK